MVRRMNVILKNRKKLTAIAGCLLLCILLFASPVRAAEVDDDKLADGEYSVSLEISGGSGKASVTSPTLMTVEDGVPYATITWSSSNYDYMIVDGVTYYNLSDEGLNSKFEIPILNWDSAEEVIADTLAMGDPVEVHYSIYFYWDTIGSKGELPQQGAIRILIVAAIIIVGGGILNAVVKRRSKY
ncbi:MAG: hypothetical protein LIO56_03440 [Lachnospiraceae bacterium]|nr:hypothetical protein [Lachnospiraceae bacterium]